MCVTCEKTNKILSFGITMQQLMKCIKIVILPHVNISNAKTKKKAQKKNKTTKNTKN